MLKCENIYHQVRLIKLCYR